MPPKPSDLSFLVVDDTATMRKIVAGALRELGATKITEEKDGQAAWGTLERSRGQSSAISFVISDVNMPNMSGVELLKKCRTSPDFKTIAFMLVTAESDFVLVREAIMAGVDEFVAKPFDPDTFKIKLGAVLKKRFPQ